MIDALESLKAQDLVSIDMRNQSDMIDCMIICTGTSSRHVSSLADNLIQQAKAARLQYVHAEGMDEAEWVLVDLGAIVVHIMQSTIRDYYQLERLWQPFAEREFNPAASS